MSTPQVIRNLSEYLFTTNARIATMTNQDTSGTSPMTAYGSANVFVTDFGVLTLVPNRIQPLDGVNTATVYIIDPQYIKLSFMRGYRVEPLAKTGLSEKRLMSVDYSLTVTAEEALAQIKDIDTTAAVVAG
jgi:hypothetical protein